MSKPIPWKKLDLEAEPEKALPAAAATAEVLRRLADGDVLTMDDHPYPIAMGVDGSVGYLYGDRIPSEFTVSQLMAICADLVVIPKGWNGPPRRRGKYTRRDDE